MDKATYQASPEPHLRIGGDHVQSMANSLSRIADGICELCRILENHELLVGINSQPVSVKIEED